MTVFPPNEQYDDENWWLCEKSEGSSSYSCQNQKTLNRPQHCIIVVSDDTNHRGWSQYLRHSKVDSPKLAFGILIPPCKYDGEASFGE